MEINKILYVEDNNAKAMDVINQLRIMGFKDIQWVRNAQETIESIEKTDVPFDLFLLDMHFDFFGSDDLEAGEKLMNLLREKGINTPVILCSSENWKIPGAFGNIFYHPDRFWEDEAKNLINRLKSI